MVRHLKTWLWQDHGYNQILVSQDIITTVEHGYKTITTRTWKNVRYNDEIDCHNHEHLRSNLIICDQTGGRIFVCYTGKIVITEFDCILLSEFKLTTITYSRKRKVCFDQPKSWI